MLLLSLIGTLDGVMFTPDAKWWNKDGLLYTINEEGTILTDHQNDTLYNIGDVS